MTRNQKIIFVSILVLVSFLLFFRLTRHDMLGDDAHYAFRSIGYFDFMASLEQTTPVQWFGERPGWSFLSFHDHPPLVFLIQYIFFKLFGVSIFVSRLPAAMAAFGSLLVGYFLGKRLGGIRTGLLATAVLALNNYFIWTGRIGLLESVFIFFLLLGLLHLIKGWQDNEKYFVWSGFYFALSFLCKYTLLFILPAIFVYLVWKKRWVFANRKFWLGVLVFLVLCSPVIVYNLQMYLTRGHLDVQFGDLFGQRHNDWTRLQNRISFSNLNLFLGILQVLISGFSWPYFVIFVLALFGSVYYARKTQQDLIYLWFLIFLFLFGFFILVGGAARWLGVLSPVVAQIIAFALYNLTQSKIYQKLRYLYVGAAFLLTVFLLFYILNTNHLARAVGDKQYWYADFRIENLGYNQLDREVAKIVSRSAATPLTAEAIRLWWYKDFNPQKINFPSLREMAEKEFNSIIIYDSNTSWFPTLWTFERWKLFKRFFMPSAEEYFKIVKSEDGLKVLQALNLDGIYLVEAAEQVAESSGINFPEIKLLVQDFKNQDIKPEIIYDDKGREAFYIYHGLFK